MDFKEINEKFKNKVLAPFMEKMTSGSLNIMQISKESFQEAFTAYNEDENQGTLLRLIQEIEKIICSPRIEGGRNLPHQRQGGGMGR